MNDRELLEAAASAAGLDAFWDQPRGADYGCLRVRSEGAKFGYVWNPLTDDGDALRLEVKLYLWEAVQLAHRLVGARDCPDIYVATRRAIVRAAAALSGVKE